MTEVEEEPIKKKPRIFEDNLQKSFAASQKLHADPTEQHASVISSDVPYQQEHIVHPRINVLTDQEEPLPKWINSVSEISKEKLKEIINLADLKSMIEGKCLDKNGKEVKYIFTEKDFQYVATKMSQKIENELNDLTMETLKETIRKLKNNISSREYRRRKREEEKAVPKNVPAKTKIQYPEISQVPKSQVPGTNFESHHSDSGSGLEESHTQAGKKLIENWRSLLTPEQSSNLVNLVKPNMLLKLIGSFTKDEEIINLANNIKPEEANNLHDPKIFQKLVRRIKTTICSKYSHSKQKQKTEEKKAMLAELKYKNKQLNEEMAVIRKQVEELQQSFMNVNISK